MAYKINNTVTIGDDRGLNFANVTVQNNGFLEVNSSDGFQGTVAGFHGAGIISSPSYIYTSAIDKYPFSTDTNSSIIGNLTVAAGTGAGASSPSHGYQTFGWTGTPTSRPRNLNKFAFATDNNAVNIGNMTGDGFGGVYMNAGHSSSTNGYTCGGFPGSGGNIEKFPFAFDSGATVSGTLATIVNANAGQSSSTHGYSAGGGGPPNTNVIQKFPFATDTNASDVGDLQQSRRYGAGHSSTTHGYISNGQVDPPNTPSIVNTIEKFPFATDTNATDIGDSTQARYSIPNGTSSTVSGYAAGGQTGPATFTNVIDKFSFTIDSNATDVGDLTTTKGWSGSTGQQD